jgi:N-dimethylarginine dimethylaminohydrolase
MIVRLRRALLQKGVQPPLGPFVAQGKRIEAGDHLFVHGVALAGRDSRTNVTGPRWLTTTLSGKNMLG